jgi:hypothetical protein
MPYHHHLHISSFALLLIAMFLLGLLALIFNFITTSRREKRRDRMDVSEASLEKLLREQRERLRREESASASPAASVAPSASYDPRLDTAAPAPPSYGYRSPPAAAAPVYVNNGGNSGTDLLTGVLLGEALSGGFGHHDTIIRESVPAYETPAYVPEPAYDTGGISFDNGPDLDDGGGDTGGIDIDF